MVHTANIEIRVCVKWSLAGGGRTWGFDCRWSMETLKNAGFKHFYDALLTYSNYGAVRTYEKFCYWMSWLRARLNRIWPRNLVPRALFPGFGGGAPHLQSQRKAPWGRGCWPRKKKKHLLSTLCTFQKEKKHPNFFPDLNSIFQTLFRSVKLLSTVNFKTLSRI